MNLFKQSTLSNLLPKITHVKKLEDNYENYEFTGYNAKNEKKSILVNVEDITKDIKKDGFNPDLLKISQFLYFHHPNIHETYGMDMIQNENGRTFVISALETPGMNFSRWISNEEFTKFSTEKNIRLLYDIIEIVDFFHRNGYVVGLIEEDGFSIKLKKNQPHITIYKLPLLHTLICEGDQVTRLMKKKRFRKTLSPELLAGSKCQTYESDIWALGMLLLQLVMNTKTPLFILNHKNDNLLEAIHKWIGNGTSVKHYLDTHRDSFDIYKYKNDFLSDLSFNLLIDLISKCLIFDPIKRISSHQMLDHVLFDEQKKDKQVKLPNLLLKIQKECNSSRHKKEYKNIREQIINTLEKDMLSNSLGLHTCILAIMIMDRYEKYNEKDIHHQVFCAAYLIAYKLLNTTVEDNFESIHGHVCYAREENRKQILQIERKIIKALYFRFYANYLPVYTDITIKKLHNIFTYLREYRYEKILTKKFE